MKVKGSHCAYLLLASCLGTLMGCTSDMLFPTMGDVKEFARQGNKSLDAHDDNMTKQHQAMHPEAADKIDELRSAFSVRLKQIEKETDALRSKQADMIRDVIKFAAQIAGLPEGLTNSITRGLEPQIAAATNEANAAMNAAENSARRAERMGANINTSMAQVQKLLNDLKDETRNKFASATEDTITKLDKVREDRAAFERILRDDLKLSDAEISDLKGMSSEQIMAMIAAAAGAAGIGVAGGRGGKSRSHEDVEKVKQQLATITADIERQKPPRVG